jgi:hypothetical protein
MEILYTTTPGKDSNTIGYAYDTIGYIYTTIGHCIVFYKC